jgi:hypothetical protein
MSDSHQPASPLDIATNRAAQKWTPRELIGRALWELLRCPLFAWTPRPLWGWRRAVLRLFGAKIGPNANILPTARIAVPWNLDLGDFAAGATARSSIIWAASRSGLERQSPRTRISAPARMTIFAPISRSSKQR